MQNRKQVVVVSLCLLLLGCEDEDKPSGASSAQICEHVCARSALAHCRNDTRDCQNKCVSVRDDSPVDCTAQLDAFTQCALRATFTCDIDGESDAVGCRALQDAWTSCYVGGASGTDAGVPTTPLPQDGSVQTPVTTDASALPASDGGSAQSDAGKDAGKDAGSDAAAPQTDAGAATPPDAGKPGVDAGGTGALLCAAEPGDEACDRCLKATCCTSIQECGPDCTAIGNCIAEPSCVTDDCYVACYAAASPSGAAQFDALTECAATSCQAACAD